MLAKLTAALIAYGPLGILVLAFIDSAGIPVASGMDALVILVAAKAPSRALLAASMGVLGSLIGNVVLFMAARTGARRFVKHFDQRFVFERVHLENDSSARPVYNLSPYQRRYVPAQRHGGYQKLAEIGFMRISGEVIEQVGSVRAEFRVACEEA